MNIQRRVVIYFICFSLVLGIGTPSFAQNLVTEEIKTESISLDTINTNINLSENEGSSLITEKKEGQNIIDDTATVLEEDKKTDDESVSEDEASKKEDAKEETEEAVEGDPDPDPEPTGDPTSVVSFSDPWKRLSGLSDLFSYDRFTGSAGFNVPIKLPKGVKNMTPQLALSYSSTSKDLLSFVGYGWNINTQAIFRQTRKGVDKLYTNNEFAVSLMGKSAELTETDSSASLFMAKRGNDLTKYVFNRSSNTWTATDTKGTKYTFGDVSSSRQSDPDNLDHVFSWYLTRAEDVYGNAITYSYTKDGEQIYPRTIEYGISKDFPGGVYQVRFNYVDKNAYPSSYQTQFLIQTKKQLSNISIDIISGKRSETLRVYNLTYNTLSKPLSHLVRIEEGDGTNTRPAIDFSYNTFGATINLLNKIDNNRGGKISLSYKPSTSYRLGDGSISNKIPFIIQTVNSISFDDATTGHHTTSTYDYEGGHYFFDYQDVFGREYAGFHIVTSTESDGTKEKTYFHQSQFSTDNPESSLKGEFEDHISKKGKLYRDEKYDASGNTLSTTITRWIKTEPSPDRYLVLSEQTTNILFDGSEHVATASSYEYDEYGNVTKNTSWGVVSADINTGDFTDTDTDRRITNISYASYDENNLVSFPSHTELYDIQNTLISKTENYYDNQKLGYVTTGNLTEKRIYDPKTEIYRQTNYSYDVYGNIIRSIDPKKHEQSLVYDTYHIYPITVTKHGTDSSRDLVSLYEYDYRVGEVSRTIAPNGFVTAYTYDNFGRPLLKLVSSTDNVSVMLDAESYIYDETTIPNKTEHRTHNNPNNPSAITISSTHTDGFGRVIQTRGEHNEENTIVVNTRYDNQGNVSYVSFPYFSKGLQFVLGEWNEERPGTRSSYDAMKRPITVSTETGKTEYEYHGFTTSIINPNGNKKDITTDAFGNKIRTTEYNGSDIYTTSYQYNILNLIVRFIDAENNERLFTYDGFGNKTSATELYNSFMMRPGTAPAWYYSYDENGNITRSTDPNGNIIEYSYDEFDRVISENLNDKPSSSYEYSFNGVSKGLLEQVHADNYTVSYVYDTHGNIISENKTLDGVSYNTEYTYDHLDKLVSIILSDDNQTTITYVYDSYGTIRGLNKDNSQIVSSVSYDPTGQVRSMVYGNGDVEEFFRSARDDFRLSRKKSSNIHGEILQDITYSYDSNGNIIGIIDRSNTSVSKDVSYIYDGLDRLVTDVLRVGGLEHVTNYSYSPSGNILTKGNKRFEYSSSHPQALSRVFKDDVLVKIFVYDNAGNMISETCESEACTSRSFSFNGKNQLSSINTDTSIYSYTYDPSGERIASRSASTEDPSTYTENTIQINPMIDKDILSGNENIYLSMNDTAIAHIARNNTAEPSSETLGYIHSDHLGGSSIITDIRGTIQVQRDYYPFGETRIDESLGTPDFNTKYQFTGQEKDEGTGLYYYHARYYHPEIGRFISVDPVSRSASEKSYFIEPQRWNQYAYSNNNPINLVDPTGELTIAVHGTEKLGLGGCSGECSRNTYNDDFITQSGNDLKEQNTYLLFDWSGEDNKQARFEGAKDLRKYINTYEFAEGEKLNMIGFSHGGNVIIESINMGLAKEVDNLILLGTPSGSPYTIQNPNRVKNIINGYEKGDGVQAGLSSVEYDISKPFFGVNMNDYEKIRFDKNTQNVEVKTEVPNIPIFKNIWKHKALHTVNVWNQISKRIK